MNVEIGTEAVQFPEKKWDFPCSASLVKQLSLHDVCKIGLKE